MPERYHFSITSDAISYNGALDYAARWCGMSIAYTSMAEIESCAPDEAFRDSLVELH